MRHILLAFVLALFAPVLRADIYECVDTNGNKRFTNIKAEAKGCKLLNVSTPNTVPGDKPSAQSQASAKPSTATPTPSSFPKVEPDIQRQRDSDRRRILGQELSNEERLLDLARKELAEQEAVRLGSERNYQKVLERLDPYKKKVKLHEDNVASLRRELAAAK
jgi:hypothetical protein